MCFIEFIEVVGKMIEEGVACFDWLFFEGVDHDIGRLAKTAHAVAVLIGSFVQRKSAVLRSDLPKESILQQCKLGLA